MNADRDGAVKDSGQMAEDRGRTAKESDQSSVNSNQLSVNSDQFPKDGTSGKGGIHTLDLNHDLDLVPSRPVPSKAPPSTHSASGGNAPPFEEDAERKGSSDQLSVISNQ